MGLTLERWGAGIKQSLGSWGTPLIKRSTSASGSR